MTETRQAISIRLTQTTLAAITRIALTEHETRTQTIERILDAHLTDTAQPQQETPGDRIAKAVSPAAPQQGIVCRVQHETLTSRQPRSHIHITAQDGCGHPRKNRINLGYATVCGTCGKRL